MVQPKATTQPPMTSPSSLAVTPSKPKATTTLMKHKLQVEEPPQFETLPPPTIAKKAKSPVKKAKNNPSLLMIKRGELG